MFTVFFFMCIHSIYHNRFFLFAKTKTKRTVGNTSNGQYFFIFDWCSASCLLHFVLIINIMESAMAPQTFIIINNDVCILYAWFGRCNRSAASNIYIVLYLEVFLIVKISRMSTNIFLWLNAHFSFNM